MKQQLIRIVAKEIDELQNELKWLVRNIAALDVFCDKDDPDPSTDSQRCFIAMNFHKNKRRKIEQKLKKLRAVQCDLKGMTAYVTKARG